MGRKLIDESNKRYGRLVVKCISDKKDKWLGPLWKCLCDCGNIIYVKGHDLRRGQVVSCGCSRRELSSERCRERNKPGKNNPAYKHGQSYTIEYLREIARVNSAKRRVLLAEVEGFHTIEDLNRIYENQLGKCLRCKISLPFHKLTVDHIIPLSWGGSDYPDNIQLLCRSCNSSKGNRHDTNYGEDSTFNYR